MNKFTPHPYYYPIISKHLVYIYIVTFFINEMFSSSTVLQNEVFMATATVVLVFSFRSTVCRLLHCQENAAFAQFNWVLLQHMFALWIYLCL